MNRLQSLPLRSPEPDATGFIDALLGLTRRERPNLVEYIVDDVVIRPVVEQLLELEWVEPSDDRASQRRYLDNLIEFWYRMGYDVIRYEQGLGFPMRQQLAPDTARGSTRTRAWADQHEGTIAGWDDFERYRWPTVEAMDFFSFEYLDQQLPAGMGLMVSHGGGLFEHLSLLMSFERLCFALHEAPDLVRALTDRLGQLMLGFYEHLLDLDRVVALFPGDDMGFRTGTLVSPDVLKKYVLPWHKRFASLAHARGVPYFLHSCGDVQSIMEDLITDVAIDGKHSFENAIMPVEDFHAQYGDRIAVLGGIDVGFLSTASPGQIRRRTRELIETCDGWARYAVGSGNSIPSYVAVENYLAMLDAAWEVIASSDA